jgi:hypothetical protein
MHSPVYQTNTGVPLLTSLIYYKPLEDPLLTTVKNPDVLTQVTHVNNHELITQIDSKLQQSFSIMCKTLGNYKSQWHPLNVLGMYPTLALNYATLVVVETEDPHQLLLENWRMYALALILSHLELSEQCFSSIFEAPSVPLYQSVCRNTI